MRTETNRIHRYCRSLIFMVCASTGLHAADTEPAAEKAPAPPPSLAAQCGRLFQDNAVFQQKIPLPVWGTSLPGAKVTVTFDTQTKNAIADKDGKWKVTLDPLTAVKLESVNEVPKGMSMTIACKLDGKEEIRTLRNIVVGEVWLCAGQSNMAGAIRTNKSRLYPEDTVEMANYPGLRQATTSPGDPWVVCTPETAPQFKKVAFFFARRLQSDIRIPIGIVAAAVGGSNIESWLNQKPFDRGGNYDNLIAPIVGYGIRGTIWYQGESNANDRRDYLPKLRSLILGWRDAWGQGDFPVYFVQLPGIGISPTDNPACGDGRAEIRQAQFEALAIKNTGMAVAIDVGDVGEHPPNKYDTGVRLARLALHNDYGQEKLVPTGPLYKSHQIEGNTVRISFDHAENGLMLAVKEGFMPPAETPDAKPMWLSMQAEDGTWHWAEGKIVGSEWIISCKEVKEPVAVRYAYTNHPKGSLLYNKDGLPASPFTTHGY